MGYSLEELHYEFFNTGRRMMSEIYQIKLFYSTARILSGTEEDKTRWKENNLRYFQRDVEVVLLNIRKVMKRYGDFVLQVGFDNKLMLGIQNIITSITGYIPIISTLFSVEDGLKRVELITEEIIRELEKLTKVLDEIIQDEQRKQSDY